jgi:fructose-specific phosphotransferase system IIB component
MKIIAVTSCPVGAAHTYMAAAALEKSAKKSGYEIKVETQGSLGFKNKLSKDDVAEADVLILSCDVACLEKERFNNITMLEVSTKKSIKDANAVIEEAISKL